MRHLLLILFLGIVLASCSKDSRTESEMIADYIADNNLVGEFTESGLFISIQNPGNGIKPTIDNRVTTHYEGKYIQDGEVFDSSLGRDPIKFDLRNVIQGWQLGIPYFGVGDEGWILIPARLAYGSFPPRGVRVNAPMAFYIELIAVE